MRKIIAFVFLATLALNLQAAEGKWLTDFDAVKKQAATEDKAILMDFTGSDWCPPCKLLKKNVFDKQEFKDYAGKKLVLMELDFPNDKSKVPRDVATSNAKLSKQFKIDAYPTIVVLDKSGKELGRLRGYEGDSAAGYTKKLDAILAKAK